MRRRTFLHALGAATAWLGTGGLVAALARSPRSNPFLIPMDADQPQPLRAYGVVYRALNGGGSAEWLLNYRGGAFLVDHPPAVGEALERGVWTEPLPDGIDPQLLLAGGDSVPMHLEVAPRVAVYAPPYAAPWDDAVRIALEFAEVPYTTIWDRDALGDGLAEIDWLHLHHEDFTGQYGKYGASIRATDWYREAVELDRRTALDLNFGDTATLKRAVSMAIREYVRGGGLMFAMCAATETLDVTLAGDPPDFSETIAFTGFERERQPVGPFSTIDGHRVNTRDRLPLDQVQVARFAPTVDPVAAMLTQNHVSGFPDWYGLTTSFRGPVVKPGAVVLATCADGKFAKYVHGDFGAGSFTFLGGHDPEDYQHAVGDAPTDLRLHPRSPGYRLILNNILFPAAEQEERKT